MIFEGGKKDIFGRVKMVLSKINENAYIFKSFKYFLDTKRKAIALCFKLNETNEKNLNVNKIGVRGNQMEKRAHFVI